MNICAQRKHHKPVTAIPRDCFKENSAGESQHTAERAPGDRAKLPAAPQIETTTHLDASVAVLRCALGIVIAHTTDKNVLLVAGKQRLRVLVIRTVIDHLDAWRALEDLVDLIQCDLSLKLPFRATQCQRGVVMRSGTGRIAMIRGQDLTELGCSNVCART